MSVPRPNLDSVTTIRRDGSRLFLHPADAPGFWRRWRRVAALVLIAVYVALPWIPVGGYPAVFLDVADRRFHLFGLTLGAQDFWLAFFLVTGLGFALFYITALLGRIWCGWACPQTVFLEHVYRRVERWIEGDAVARRRLDAAPWDGEKIAKRALKHGLFIVLSLAIVHVFLAYFVSLPRLYEMVTHAPTRHWTAFVFMAIATGVVYFNFAWFREQLCLIICPYGRLQSALIDDHSLVIGYDARRGEPRARRGASATSSEGGSAAQGDCIDCFRCVQVCPTGIDIRQGLQMECIGCSACIDACDEVMRRTRRPTGLIRYDSLAAFAGGRTRWVRPRIVVYTLLLVAGAVAMLNAFSTVRPARFDAMRLPGGSYFLDATAVRNQFLVRLTNKTSEPRTFAIALIGAPPELLTSGIDETLTVGPMAEAVHTIVLRAPIAGYRGPLDLMLEARDVEGDYTLRRRIRFLGPDPRLLRQEHPVEREP